MEQSFHRCISFIWNWSWFARKFIALCNTLRWSALRILFSLQWVLEKRETDENLNSSVVAEPMKLLANSSYVYQIMDRSRHTIIKYLSDEKTHQAINNKIFKRLGYKNDQLYEAEVVKSDFEHKEPSFVGFFILQYAKLGMLLLYYNFFDKYSVFTTFEELELDTDSLYLEFFEKDLYDCIRPTVRQQ